MAALPVAPRDADEELRRRRRGRNWAMLIVLLGLALLFYAIALVKLSRPVVGG